MEDRIQVNYSGALGTELVTFVERHACARVVSLRPLVLQGQGLGRLVEELLNMVSRGETVVEEILVRRGVPRMGHSAA